MPAKLARGHVLDHALTQLAGGVGTHGKLLSWMRLTTPRSSRQGCTARYRCSQLVTAPSDSARRGGLLRSDLVPCAGFSVPSDESDGPLFGAHQALRRPMGHAGRGSGLASLRAVAGGAKSAPASRETRG